VVRDLGGVLLGTSGESTLHRQRRKERVPHKSLALLLRIPDNRDQVAALRRSAGVRMLALGQSSRWMQDLDHRPILLLCAAGPEMYLQV